MITTRTLRAALLSSAIVGIAAGAQAAGTAPGVSVPNTIDLSYSSGGSTITQNDAAAVTFVVDRKVDFILEGQDAGATVQVRQGQDTQVLLFRLENEGNDTSGYDINVASAGSIGLTLETSAGNVGNEGTFSVVLSTNPNTDAASIASDTLYNPGGTTTIGDVAADGIRYVKIVAHIPAAANDGDSDTFTVTATALDAGGSTITAQTAPGAATIGGVDTFFGDTGEDGVEISAESYVVTAPILSATKVSSLISEDLDGTFDCATGAPQASATAFVPGACIEYVITVTNGSGATGDATSLVVSDPLPAEVTYVTTTATPGFDSVVFDVPSSTVTGTVAALAPGASASFTIRATID